MNHESCQLRRPENISTVNVRKGTVICLNNALQCFKEAHKHETSYSTGKHLILWHWIIQWIIQCLNNPPCIKHWTQYYKVSQKKGNPTSTSCCAYIIVGIRAYFFDNKKDQAFSCWMIRFSHHMEKKWENTSLIQNLGQNRIFHLCKLTTKLSSLWDLSWSITPN